MSWMRVPSSILGILVLVGLLGTNAEANRLFTCGFEENNTTETMWTTASGGTIVTTNPHSGTYHGQVSSGNFQRNLSSVKSSGTLFTRGYWRTSSFAASIDNFTVTVGDGGGSMVLVGANNSAQPVLQNGATTTTVTDTATTLSINTWYRVEARHLIANAGGEMEMRIYLGDSTTLLSTLSITNEDTIHSNSTGVSSVRWGAGAVGRTHQYDDIIINNEAGAAPFNTWPGPGKIALVVPATVVSAQWEDGATGSPGAGDVNATNLDDLPGTPDDGTTFNREDDTLNQIDRLAPTGLPAEVPSDADIIAVDVYARIGGAGASNGILKLWDESSSLTDGPTMAFAAAYKILSTTEHLAFDAGTRTKTNINAFNYGYENTSVAATAKDISALWVNVEWIEAGAAEAQPQNTIRWAPGPHLVPGQPAIEMRP